MKARLAAGVLLAETAVNLRFRRRLRKIGVSTGLVTFLQS
jgi:hypothetical protein